jgi:hypothetical protein
VDKINLFHNPRSSYSHAAVVLAPHEMTAQVASPSDGGPSPAGPAGPGTPSPAAPKTTGSAATHEPAIYRAHATVVAFDNGTYTATIALARSPQTTIAGVPVSRSIAAGLMIAGATAAVIFFDHQNSADSMIVGVH